MIKSFHLYNIFRITGYISCSADSNPCKANLTKCKNIISVNFQDFDDNMNLEINQAMIDNMRLIKLK